MKVSKSLILMFAAMLLFVLVVNARPCCEDCPEDSRICLRNCIDCDRPTTLATIPPWPEPTSPFPPLSTTGSSTPTPSPSSTTNSLKIKSLIFVKSLNDHHSFSSPVDRYLNYRYYQQYYIKTKIFENAQSQPFVVKKLENATLPIQNSTLSLSSPPKLKIPYTVTYDGRSIMINGERQIFISGSMHYARSTPSMWKSILQYTKDAGVNMIDTYVFWNLHEPQRGQYNFEGNANLTQFLDLCQEMGFYVNLRIGPYVCAEWNYGGFPYWLREVPGMKMRDFNMPFMIEMERWVKYLVTYLKPYFAPQGGPIILAQIENEYNWVEWKFLESGRKFSLWCADMANSLNIGVPWIMCQQDDVDTVINTCNGFYCHEWIQFHWQRYKDQPPLFTENWSGWFGNWWKSHRHRPVEDIVYASARWFANGGSLLNYYMWHGGTNFGRTSGPYITTSYDYDAPLDEYGYPRIPKYPVLKSFNLAIGKIAHILLSQIPPSPITIRPDTEMIRYQTHQNESATFFINTLEYTVLILHNDKPIFDSTVSIKESIGNGNNSKSTNLVSGVNHQQNPSYLEYSIVDDFSNAEITKIIENLDKISPTMVSGQPMEQLNVTKDNTDYIWYITSIAHVKAGDKETLRITNYTDVIHVFVDNKYIDTMFSDSIEIKNLSVGEHTLQLLHTKIGVQHYELNMELVKGGITGNVYLGNTSITNQLWGMRPYLSLEKVIFDPNISEYLRWSPLPRQSVQFESQPLSWYKFKFYLNSTTTIIKSNSFVFDMSNMTKGMIWVNGNNIGRYWITKGWGGCEDCEYKKKVFDPYSCSTDCGEITQYLYHLPIDWLKLNDYNEVLVLEECKGDPRSIKLQQVIYNHK